ncbi:MAG TPA: YCF48-related protein [Fibrobacteria bacterium]|nr:YCF48-related protein [Fibrobacteria bacterium]
MNWATKRFRPYRYGFVLAVLTAAFFGCLTKQEPDTFTLPEKFVDSLSRYDSVQIILKDTHGNTLDLLFHGKVRSADQLKDLPAPHALDGDMLVTLIGYQGGRVTYLVDRVFDGKTNQVEIHQPIILPTSKVGFEILELRIPKKATVPLPTVTVEPADLADKSLLWTSSNPKIFEIDPKGLRGMAPGTAYLHVSLKSDTAKHADIPVTVFPNPKLPDSLKIAPDTLKIAAKGRTGQFTLQAFPTTANAVSWHVDDSTVALIVGGGQIQGLKRGAAKVKAVSKEDETIADSAMVAVSDPISVESVRFPKNRLELFVEGAAESLQVEVRPQAANPEAAFSVRDSSIARIVNGRILGLREGETYVTARSIDTPTKTDSLRVMVYPAQKVDSLRISPDTLRLYVGGEPKMLQAKLYPSNLVPLIQWASASPAIAVVDSAGKVRPIKEGKSFITAISRADSGKKAVSLILVKQDVPILDVGRDTTIPVGRTMTFTPKVTQEYGAVTRFKWDLNGDGAWDDSASELKSVAYKYDDEKEVAVGFYVRDTEGNDTSVVKRVKAVKGPVINIFSPPNNSYSNKSPIAVAWSVDGKDQEIFLKETLKEGANIVTRTAKDTSGNTYAASITVYYDTTAPDKPIVTGPAKTAMTTPTWTWKSGGHGGAGVYRINLDKEDFTGIGETKDTSFTWEKGFKEGVYALYVQERDAAGNWSAAGRFSIKVDLTPPGIPNIVVNPSSPTNDPAPVWSWTSGGNGDKGWFRYQLDDSTFSEGSAAGTGKTFKPNPPGLREGVHTLFVQEQDSAGNWSYISSRKIELDLTPPLAPKISSTSFHTTNSRPIWHWSTGGNGGSGLYRYRLDTPPDQANGSSGSDTSYAPSADFAAGSAHTLYVQEQDGVGNWSLLGSLTLNIHNQIGFAGGDAGILFKTTNGGGTWDSVYSGTSKNIRSIDFLDAMTGFAVGDSGAFIKSVNGGNSWSAHSLSTTTNLNSILFMNSKNGVAVGQNGVILKSTNAGISWQSVSSGVTQSLNALYFSESGNGYTAGGNGTILKTVDGGSTWTALASGVAQSLQSIFFTDFMTGFVCGENGTILKTTNGGSTWIKLASNSVQSLQSIYFVDGKTGYAAGKTGRIMLKTGDGGDTWKEIIPETWVGTHPVSLNSICFTDAQTGYAAGKGGSIYMTKDGGETWSTGRAIVITGPMEFMEPELFSIVFP